MTISETRTRALTGIAPLLDRYDGFVLDVWGVLHNGHQPYPGVVAALTELRRLGKGTVLLSNAPARASTVADRLTKLGIASDLYGGIVTSGEEVWLKLRDRDDDFYATLGHDCLWLGPERHVGIREGLGLRQVGDVAAASFLLNSGPDDLDAEASAFLPLLAEALARDLPMICANADRIVVEGTRTIYCAGQLAEIYARSGGRVREHGKPLESVYRMALDVLGLSDRGRILAIGDNLHTDIAGGCAFGIDSALVACGIHAAALGFAPEAPVLDLAKLAALTDSGDEPTWLLPGLRL